MTPLSPEAMAWMANEADSTTEIAPSSFVRRQNPRAAEILAHIAAQSAEIARLNQQILANTVDAMPAGTTLIKTAKLDELKAEIARLKEYRVMANEEVRRIEAECNALAEKVRELTTCECGKPLGRGYCKVCDNDE